MKSFKRVVLTSVVMVSVIAGLVVSQQGTYNEYVEQLQNGFVDWGKGVIRATGSGAPSNDPKLNLAQRRLGAERALLRRRVRGAAAPGPQGPPLMAGYRPDIPPHAAAVIRHLPPEVKRGIKAAIRALSADPAAGEPLQRELKGLWKYRVRRFRVVYAIDRPRRILRIMAIGHRRAVYEAMADFVRGRR